MSENLNSAVQTPGETQFPTDGASATIVLTKPNPEQSRSLSKEHASDGVSPAAHAPKPTMGTPGTLSKKHASDGVSPANTVTKPSKLSPGTSSTKRGRKIARAATIGTMPIHFSPPTPSKKHASDGVSPATCHTKPIDHPPGTSSTKRDRKIARAAMDDARPRDVMPPTSSKKHASDGVSPATTGTKPNGPKPGDSLSGDHARREAQITPVSARRSMSRAKPMRSLSGVNSEGHPPPDTQNSGALNGRAILQARAIKIPPDHSLRDGHLNSDNQNQGAVAGDDRFLRETQNGSVIAQIQELWRRRQSWHRAEKSLTLQCSAICRRTVGARGIVVGMSKKETAANKILLNKASAMLERIEEGATIAGDQNAAISCLPILAGREPLRNERKAVEKTLGKLVRTLPIWTWAEPIPGIAELSIYSLIGECGDIGSYRTASCVWKRLGLAVINGERQRRVTGPDALLHGYSPQRRSVAWNVGGALIGGMGRGPRPYVGQNIEANNEWSRYQKRFVELLRKEAERVTDTWDGPAHKRKPVERDGVLYESYSSHAANRIKRRITKEFLAELYGEWRKTGGNHAAP